MAIIDRGHGPLVKAEIANEPKLWLLVALLIIEEAGKTWQAKLRSIA